jgi:hypothetical protein
MEHDNRKFPKSEPEDQRNPAIKPVPNFKRKFNLPISASAMKP